MPNGTISASETNHVRVGYRSRHSRTNAKRTALAPRFVTGADQVVSNLSNMLMTVGVARTVGVDDFARYAIVYAVVVFMTGAQRAVINEPLVIRLNRDSRSANFEVGGALGLATVFLGILLTGGLCAGVITSSAFFVEATVAVVACLAQDAFRFCFIAVGRPRTALCLDGAWFALILLAYAGSFLGFPRSVQAWLAIWTVGALIGIVAGICAFRVRVGHALAWFQVESSLSGNMFLEHLFGSGITQITLLMLPITASLTAVAAVRVAQTSAGILYLCYNAIAIVALSPMARTFRDRGSAAARTFARKVSLGNFCLGVIVAIVLFAVPMSWGTAALGQSWRLGHTISPLIALQVAVLGATTPIAFFLRVSRKGRRSSLIRMVAGPGTLAAVLAISAVAGTLAIAATMLGCACLTALLFQIVSMRSGTDLPDGAVATQTG